MSGRRSRAERGVRRKAVSKHMDRSVQSTKLLSDPLGLGRGGEMGALYQQYLFGRLKCTMHMLLLTVGLFVAGMTDT